MKKLGKLSRQYIDPNMQIYKKIQLLFQYPIVLFQLKKLWNIVGKKMVVLCVKCVAITLLQ